MDDRYYFLFGIKRNLVLSSICPVNTKVPRSISWHIAELIFHPHRFQQVGFFRLMQWELRLWSLSIASTPAPFSINIWATCVCPFENACIRAVLWLLSLASTMALFSISIWTTWLCPCDAARIRAVLLIVTSPSLPYPTLPFPLEEAIIRAVLFRPSLSFNTKLTSTLLAISARVVLNYNAIRNAK